VATIGPPQPHPALRGSRHHQLAGSVATAGLAAGAAVTGIAVDSADLTGSVLNNGPGRTLMQLGQQWLDNLTADPLLSVLQVAATVGPGRLGGVAARGTPQTTILGENMRDRVIPFANATDARVLPWGTTPQQWAQMTPQQRWKLNDGALRARINEGDSFRYIGIDPGRPAAERLRFDLTRSELLRLNDRGVPFETVSPQEVISTIGRP